MKAASFDRPGNPEDVLQVLDVPTPTPRRGQVRIRMLASPINPSDLLFVRGLYGRLPHFPAIPGFEGVGIVEQSGGGLLARRVMGRRVAVLNSSGGNWAEQVVIPAKQAIPVPTDLTDDQAATFFVNPASALIMVRHVLKVPSGAWLLQTAAGSALGRMVIRLGKVGGFKTINVVRRREQVDELKRLGANEVICTAEESLSERVSALTAGAGVLHAMDAVGGSLGSEAVGTLGRGGRLLVYGALSGEPLTLDPRTLIVGQKRVEGFWLGEWMASVGLITKFRLMKQLGRMLQSGLLSSTIGQTYPLAEVRSAVALAAQPGREGKVLLRIAER